jgi:hypothetical protein
MFVLWLVPLILASAFAVAGAEGAQWKLINFAIILVCMGVGLGIGYAAGEGSGNLGRIPDAALPFSMILGIVGAMGCVAQNRSRGNA